MSECSEGPSSANGRLAQPNLKPELRWVLKAALPLAKGGKTHLNIPAFKPASGWLDHRAAM